MHERGRDIHRCLTALLIWTVGFSSPTVRSKADDRSKQERGPSSPFFQSALRHYQSGELEAAEKDLLPLLNQPSQGFDVSELMGLILTAEDRPSQALPYLQNAVRLNPASAEARSVLAGCLAALGRMAEAEVEFKKVVTMKPGDYESNHNIGVFYLKAGKLKLAVPYLEKAQKIRPSAYDNGYDLALLHLRAHRARGAKNILLSLVAQKDSAELHNLLGEANEQGGDYLGAAKEYEKAARLDPSESNIFDWGTELLLHHTFEPAIQVFSFGIEKHPSSARMEIGLGLSFYGRSQYEKACAAFVRATDLSPDDPRPYLVLGEIYASSRVQMQGVAERLERLTQIDPKNAKAFYYYALSVWKGNPAVQGGKDLNKAESLLKTALSLDNKLADAYNQLGNLYSDESKAEEAIAAYQNAINRDPSLADAHYHLGQLYKRIGRNSEAQKEFGIYQQLHQRQLAETEKQRGQIQRFVYTMSREGKDQTTATH